MDLSMDKANYLEQLKQQNSPDQAAEQATNNYWLESKALNEVFQIFESDKTIPMDLYVNWKQLNKKTWSELNDRIALDLRAKNFLLDLCQKDVNRTFEEEIWIATLNRCLKDPGYSPKDFYPVVFAYEHQKNKREIDDEIGPIKELLIELEQIVGNECFNINKAEPWRRWGVLEPTCERLRYPLTFETGYDKTVKIHVVPANITNTDFISGKYVFGGNQLDIVRGLYKVLKHLKSKRLLNDSVEL